MNRGTYFNYIEEKLNTLSYRINARGKINILDLNLHCENFYMDLLNLIYGLCLENLNTVSQNVEGIDLIDEVNKLIIQVSSTSTKQKIESTLSKEIFREYSGYSFKFISISKPADNLRKNSFKNPYSIKFDCENDIYDIPVMLRHISSLGIDKQKELYEFVKKELGREVDTVRVDSDLAVIINIISKESLSNVSQDINVNSFEIEKKIKFNELDMTEMIINDYKIYYSHLEKKYKEFDNQGVNKSFSVFQAIRTQYMKLCIKKDYDNNDMLFLNIIENIKKIILESNNYENIPFEELEMCVCIIVVDAFIRCKIFKNPEGYNYVITR
ncbi:ABC-three component system protein [uncultured Clostridium sp.]|uniref:ABC-three component system protein n=1 Tax=uncultured Clostridium sp. TaxID=59620 RepID=UPI0028E71A33|nr:ABC-three component system protein [uncultured Clostridium sp.]